MPSPFPVSNEVDALLRSTAGVFNFASGDKLCTITVNATNGKVEVNNNTGEDYTIKGNNFTYANFSYGGMYLVGSASATYSVTGEIYAAGTARYRVADGVSGLGSPAINQASLVANGVDTFTATTTQNISALPIQLKSYTVSTLPSASPAGQIVYVSDAAVAPCMAFSNGTNWKRCDNAATTVV